MSVVPLLSLRSASFELLTDTTIYTEWKDLFLHEHVGAKLSRANFQEP